MSIRQQGITSSMTIRDILDQYPQTMQVFIAICPMCVGCPAEAFHTLADISEEYRLNLNRMLQLLNAAINSEGSE